MSLHNSNRKRTNIGPSLLFDSRESNVKGRAVRQAFRDMTQGAKRPVMERKEAQRNEWAGEHAQRRTIWSLRWRDAPWKLNIVTFDANYEKATVRKLFLGICNWKGADPKIRVITILLVKQMSLHNSNRKRTKIIGPLFCLNRVEGNLNDRSSIKERKGNALASGADEGRDKLR